MVKDTTVECINKLMICIPNDCLMTIHKVTAALVRDLAALNSMGMLWQKKAQHYPLSTIERRIDLCMICIVG